MIAKVYAGQVLGLTPQLIDVEIDISNGLHSFSIIGLADRAIEEARDRISSAIKNSGIRSPKKGNKKIIVSLAPADIKKEGTLFDLSIALSYLLATEEAQFLPEGKLFIGELSLNGDIRPVKGVLFITKMAKEKGFSEIYLPKANAGEASFVSGIKVFGIKNLGELLDHFSKEKKYKVTEETLGDLSKDKELRFPDIDFSDIRGQESAKRGLLIAASGRHNVAMYGPPGTGKTMLARAFCGILPSLSFKEALETTGIHSVAGILDGEIITHAPLRSPHHTSSFVSVVGGGAYPRPGEITLAHNGVLFLDELPFFDKRVLESLRQPLEDRVINISRSKGSVKFPANFILVAALNPCPCGNHNVLGRECVCLPNEIERYKKKLSGPIMDRIDMWLDVPKISFDKMSEPKKGELSVEFLRRVGKAREIQAKRLKNYKISTNGEMSSKNIEKTVHLGEKERNILNQSAEKLDLSARAYHKVIKLAQTIADLEESPSITVNHLLEALQYRPKKDERL